MPDVAYRSGQGGQERGALGRVNVIQDEAEEGEQGELGRVGHQAVAQGGPFPFGDVLGCERKEGGFLVVEVFEQGRPVIGGGRHKGVELVGFGGGRSRRDCGVRPGQRGLSALVLGLHVQDDVRLQIDPGHERRTQQFGPAGARRSMCWAARATAPVLSDCTRVPAGSGPPFPSWPIRWPTGPGGAERAGADRLLTASATSSVTWSSGAVTASSSGAGSRPVMTRPPSPTRQP